MRSFQVLRYRRRTTSANNELSQPAGLTSLSKRRNSTSLLPNEQNQDQRPFLLRRNTLLPNIDSSSRRLSFQQPDLIELTKPQTNMRNFYIFFLILFLFIFASVIYSFIRMIKNPD